MEFNSRGLKHSRAHNFVLKPRNEQYVRELSRWTYRTEILFPTYLLFRRPIRGIISGSLLPLLPPLITDGLHLNNERLDPIDSYIRMPTRFVSKFNAPANLLELKLSRCREFLRELAEGVPAGVHDEDEDFSNLPLLHPKLNISAESEQKSISMYANYRTQRGLLLSESNETPTRPACISCHGDGAPRRRKSRALVWMHPYQDPSYRLWNESKRIHLPNGFCHVKRGR